MSASQWFEQDFRRRREAMIAERNDMEAGLCHEMGARLGECRSAPERDHMRAAFYQLMYMKADEIEQRYGFSGRLHRAVV